MSEPNHWDQVPDAVFALPDHMVADAPEDDRPPASAGDWAPDHLQAPDHG